MVNNLQIRPANEADIPLILRFIRELADYERLLDQIAATEELLHEWMFVKEKAEAVIGELNGQPVAFALFFHNFSTFMGRAGIYLDDLYVIPEARGQGIGKALLKYLAQLTVERGCGRLEWACLNWNTNSINFYLSLGAKAMDEWKVYRLSGDTLANLADK